MNTSQVKQFMRFEFTWGKIALWGITCLLPVIGIYYSNKDVFFDLGKSVTVGLIIALAGGLWLAVYTKERHLPTRRAAIHGIVWTAVSLFISLGLHQWLARDMADARDTVAERNMELENQQKLKDADAARQIKLKQADADLAEAKAKENQTEADRMRLIPKSRRGGYVPPAAAVPEAITPEATATPGEIVLHTRPRIEKKEEDVRQTPEQVRRAWAPWLAGASWLDAIVVGLCCVWVYMKWSLDENGNGKADGQEAREAAEPLALTPAQTEQLIKLLGPGSKQGPGFQPPVKAEKARD